MVGVIDIIAVNNIIQVVIFLKNEIEIELFFSFFASWQYYYIIVKMFMHMCAIRGRKRNLIHVLT